MQGPSEYFLWVWERRVDIVNAGCRQSMRIDGGCDTRIIESGESGNFFDLELDIIHLAFIIHRVDWADNNVPCGYGTSKPYLLVAHG